jgi:hypothetical protein
MARARPPNLTKKLTDQNRPLQISQPGLSTRERGACPRGGRESRSRRAALQHNYASAPHMREIESRWLACKRSPLRHPKASANRDALILSRASISALRRRSPMSSAQHRVISCGSTLHEPRTGTIPNHLLPLCFPGPAAITAAFGWSR